MISWYDGVLPEQYLYPYDLYGCELVKFKVFRLLHVSKTPIYVVYLHCL